MRYLITMVLLATCFRGTANCQTTIVYNRELGSLTVNSVDPITTFELKSSEPFFTGPRPAVLDGLFDVWNPLKAFRLFPSGFTEMEFGPGSVETGVTNAPEMFTLDGSFLAGGALRPVEFVVVPPIPEPSSLVLLGLGALGLAVFRRQRTPR